MDNQNKRKKIIGWIIFLLIVGIIVGFFVYKNGTRKAVYGIDDPIQTEVSPDGTSVTIDDYKLTITYLYSYDIEALVVHTKDYIGFSVDDKLSPIDLALTWGAVAEYNEFIDFHWSQSGRWCYYKVDSQQELDNVGGIAGITSHMSNNHIIPANNDILNKVRWIRRGDHLRLKGYLVNVDGRKPDGTTFLWHSSTTRDDTGNHACEVFYVTDVQWVQ